MTTSALDIVSTDQFTWNGRNGTAMASDLGFHVGYMPENMLVRSVKTGTHLRFQKHSQKINEGDLLYTRYLGVASGLFVDLMIFND